MAEQPDFTVKTPAIDPTAFATVLQRKQEQEDRNMRADEERRNGRLQRILAAVQGGQAIATNMLNIAEKRQAVEKEKQRVAGVARLDNALNQPVQAPTAQSSVIPGAFPVQPSPEQTKAMETQRRTQELQRALLQANPDDVTKQMADMQFPKPMTGNAAKPIPMNMELPGGEQTLGYFDPTQPAGQQYRMQDGTPAPAGTKRSYKYDLRADSEGNLNVISGASGKKVNTIDQSAPLNNQPEGSVTAYAKLPPTTRAEVVKQIQSAQVDPAIKAEKLTYVNMNRLSKAVQSDNKAISSKLGLVFQKALGDVGNITEQEQRQPGSKQLLDQGAQLFDTYIRTGVLTPDNKKIVMSAIEVLKDVSLENYNKLVEIESDQVLSAYPQLNGDFVKRNIGGTLIEEYSKKKADSEKKKQAAAETTSKIKDMTTDAIKARIAELKGKQ